MGSRLRNFLEAACQNKGNGTQYATAFILVALTWTLLFYFFDKQVEPGGEFFALLSLVVLGHFSGKILALLKLPPLLGMVASGIVLTNVGVFQMTGIWLKVVDRIRDLALMTILVVAGLNLNGTQLKQQGFAVAGLSFLPCMAEAGAVAVAAHYFMQMPWLWGLLLGFVLGAVTPAVVVPSLLELRKKGYGESSGVFTLVMAASSFDDVVAISAFGILIGMIFSQGTLTENLLHGPIEAGIGVIVGLVGGIIASFFPHKDEAYLVTKRTFMIGGGSFAAVLFSSHYGYSGVGPLAAMVGSFVASQCWKQQGWSENENPVANIFENFWTILEPLLFGLIGTDIHLEHIDEWTLLDECSVLVVGLAFRIVMCTMVMLATNLSSKEIIFINLSWLPKATVQATLGPVALNLVTKGGFSQFETFAKQILTIAVLSIVITAPIGALGISFGGKALLRKTRRGTEDTEVDDFNQNEA